MWTFIPSLLGAGLFPYWLGSFAYPRRSKNERNAVTGAICHDERFWVLVGSSAIRKLPVLHSQLVLDRLLSECLWRQPA
jgi:hypothetical protein